MDSKIYSIDSTKKKEISFGFLRKVKEKLGIYSELTLFPFVIFTLPFSFVGAILAQWTLNSTIIPSWQNIFWIILATISARNAGMAINRLLDKDIDSENPRTRDRALVTGKIKEKEVILFTVFSLMVLVLSAGMLNRLCLYLSPIPIFLLLVYPLAKRYTWLNHFVLGGVLFFAPAGGWIAIKGSWDAPATILGLSVLFWSSGFDIIYDREDIAFYKDKGLFSIPKLLGERASQSVALTLHVFTIVSLFFLQTVLPLGTIYLTGILVIAGLILYGHVSTRNAEYFRTNKTFFWINAFIAVGFLLFTILDLITEGR